jgi:MFS transporter, PPP family, 3-phenylpropionic acid transporter
LTGRDSAAPPPGRVAPYGWLWLAYFATVGVFNPYAPLWFKALGLSTLAIGALASLQSWTRLLAPYAWSWLADHSGQRVQLLRLAAAGSLVSALGLALWPDLPAGPMLAVLVALLFLANGGVVPLAEAALAQILFTRQGMDAARYGRVRVWGSVGFIVAVMAAGPWLQAAGIGAFAWTVVALNLALLATAWRLPVLLEPQRSAARPPPVWPRLRQPAVAWFYASVFFTVLAHASLYAFFSLFLDALGYGKSAVGLFWAVSVGCEIAFFFTQGRWFGRCTPHRWLQWAAGVSALRFAATALGGGSALVLVLAQATHAITFAAHHAACIALMARYFPDRLRGRGQALYSALGYGLSGLVGGVGGGWLIEHLGYAAVFWAACAAALAGLACAGLSARADGEAWSDGGGRSGG